MAGALVGALGGGMFGHRVRAMMAAEEGVGGEIDRMSYEEMLDLFPGHVPEKVREDRESPVGTVQ